MKQGIIGKCGLVAGLGALLVWGGGSVRAAEALIIVDNQTGHILASKNAREKRQVASLTKLATACVVLDMAELKKIDLNQVVGIPPSALNAGGANPVGLQSGDGMSLRDLLYCSLLASDNIAATALAHHAGTRVPNPEGLSPVGNFVVQMNALARGLKMRRTLFLNPSGLDGGEQSPPFSTAEDMARLTCYAYRDGDIPFYVSQKSRTVHVFREGQEISITINNTNELLGQEGIDGVKTGRTAKAGDCLILSSERTPEVRKADSTTYVTPRRIQIILLGSPDRFGEGIGLTRRGWGLYDTWARGGRKTDKSKAL
ncbi:MAG: serine hydrolase [Terrimicrobiaceae bacterium]